MVKAKRKSKVKKVHAAKKKAVKNQRLKSASRKPRAAKKPLRAKAPARAKRLVAPRAAPAKPVAGKPDDKAAPKTPIKSAKQALELLEAKVNEVKARFVRICKTAPTSRTKS